MRVSLSLWAVLIGRVTVAHIVKEVNLVFSGKKRRGDAVHGGVTPPLARRNWSETARQTRGEGTYLVIKTPGLFKIVKILGVRLTSPEV